MKNLSRRLISVLPGALLATVALAQEKISVTRQDTKSMPLSVYAPALKSCAGIAIISPGAGGTETGYSYLGKAMSSLNYLTVVVGHQESGPQALKDHMQGKGLRKGLSALVTDAQAYEGRLQDIAAARQWASEHCDAKQSILLGHSMGAATVMIEAGAANKPGVTGADVFDAYVALSPQGPGGIFPADAWKTIRKPVLTMTGTRDSGLDGAWETRTEPFKNMTAGCKWLGIVDGATHMNFAGVGMSRKTETLTVKTIEAFLAGVHRGDCKPTAQEEGMSLQVK